MAIVNITIIEGREREVKNRIIEGVTEVLVRELNAKPEQVRVVFNEVGDGDYAVGGKPVFLHS